MLKDTLCIDKIFITKSRNHFYRLTNADGKQWLIPSRNMRTALQLYQPGAWKGKAVKAFLPMLKHFPALLAPVGLRSETCRLAPELEKLLENSFKASDLEFSVFFGTPSVHQKITLQISLGRKILGYCRISNDPAMHELFEHEKRVLSVLNNKGISGIPQFLCLENIEGNIKIFAQNTTKTTRSLTQHALEKRHLDFLNELYRTTSVTLPFEKSDFFSLLKHLEKNLEFFAPSEQETIRRAIQSALSDYQEKVVEFSMTHGDFTPWNSFIENGQLFVFDWEYALFSAPPFIDAFHFFTQGNILENKLSAAQILRKYRKQKSLFRKYVSDPDRTYRDYLLQITAFYVKREKGRFNEKEAGNLRIWIQLLDLLS